jgi:putative ABC transport system permease protein
MLGVTIMIGSFRESLADWLGRTLSADIYVSAPGPGFGRPERRLDPDVVQDLLSTPGIADHAATRRVRVQSDRGSIALEALELAGPRHRGIDLLDAEGRGNAHDHGNDNGEAVWRAFHRGELIVSQPFSYRQRVKAGDRLTLSTEDGPRGFRIAGLYRDYGNDRGTVLIDRGTYRRHWHDEGLSALGLYLTPGLTTDAVLPQVRAAVRGRQALFIRSNADLRALSLQIFDRTFAITRVLEWLAAGVAIMGLLSALLAWELERTREIAVLRALGLSAGGTARMIMLQTFFMGSCALIAALPAGLLTAWVLIEAINQRAFGWQIDLHLHAGQLTGAALLALGASLAAGLYPAWRGANAPIATGMREE